MNKITNDGYIIKKNKKNEELIKKHKAQLTVTPEKNTDYGGDTTSFTVYKEDKGSLIVPKYYGIRYIGPAKNLIDTSECKVDFQFLASLRGTQVEVAKSILEKLQRDNINKNGGILQLHTGYGKTVLALYLASILKVKTLILVHKTFLMDQWYDRIKKFTNASIGIIRQKKTDTKNKDIVIGMLQSVSMIDYDESVFEGYGLLLVDECHRTGSEVFSKAFLKVSPKYTIGLSATPIRNDGMTKIIRWFLGDIMVKVERIGDNAVYVKSFEYSSNDPLFVEKKRWVKGKVSPDTVKMTSNLCKIKGRNIFVSNIINALRKKEGRKILVLSGRLDHLTILKDLVDSYIKDDVLKNQCLEDEFKTAFYIGGMKDYQLDDAASADVLFGTYSMAEEGLDIDGLNTLVLASPKKDVIQAIGRIMRKPIEEGDINPLVIDIRDMLSCFENWGSIRNKYYKSKKYTVNRLKAKNKDVISFKEYMIDDGLIKANEFKINMDIRKEYIIRKFGQYEYDCEQEVEFFSYPDDMFNYPTDYSEIFTINHVFKEGEEENEKKVIIDYDPVND